MSQTILIVCVAAVQGHLVPMPGYVGEGGYAERGLPSALSPRCPWAAVADDPARAIAAPTQPASTDFLSSFDFPPSLLHETAGEAARPHELSSPGSCGCRGHGGG